MMDWADEIADYLHNVMRFDSDTGGFSRERFSAALRKAKADGMNEAGLRVEKKLLKGGRISRDAVFQVLNDVYSRSAEIEKGNA